MVDGSSSSAAPLQATQTDVSGPPGQRMLHSSTSSECHPDRHPRRSQTAWSTEAPLLQLHCRPPRQTPTTFSDCLSNECHPDRHPRRFRTAWATDAALLHLRKMQPRQTSTTFSDCLGEGSSSSAILLHATQTYFHDVLRLLGRRKLLFCSSIACHPDRHPRRSRTA